MENAADESPMPNPKWKMALLSLNYPEEGSDRCGGRISNAKSGVEDGNSLLNISRGRKLKMLRTNFQWQIPSGRWHFSPRFI